MTLQEIFDKSVEYQRIHGQAYEHGCWYRSPSGKKCAVGCLIPDELYNPQVESTVVCGLFDTGTQPLSYVVLSKMLLDSGLDKGTWTLLSELQNIHDSKWNRREEEWQELANKFSLTLSKNIY